MSTIRKSALSFERAAMEMARVWALARSKADSPKVGAVIIDDRTLGMFLGYDGFPAGVPDSEDAWDREVPTTKLLTRDELVTHAEMNALRMAALANVRLESATVAVTHRPCHWCFQHLANFGVRRILCTDATRPGEPPEEAERVRKLSELLGVELVVVAMTVTPTFAEVGKAAATMLADMRGPKLPTTAQGAAPLPGLATVAAPNAPGVANGAPGLGGPGQAPVNPQAPATGAEFATPAVVGMELRGRCSRCELLNLWRVDADKVRHLIYEFAIPGKSPQPSFNLSTHCTRCGNHVIPGGGQ